MRRILYPTLFILIAFLQSSAISQTPTQFKLKNFIPEVFQASATTSLTTVRHALPSSDLALIVNILDPQSVQVANYYQNARKIPVANIIQVSFPPGQQNMAAEDFNIIRASVLSKTPANVQAYALTWTTPWKVDCMSITSAFAFGFNTAYCQPENAGTCYATILSQYYSTNSKLPRTDFSIIPTMMLGGFNFPKVQAVIDRGVLSDFTFPKGDGYLYTTTDPYRNVRTTRFNYAASVWNDPVNSLKITHINNSAGTGPDYLENVQNILFYFTGAYQVEGLSTLKFVPGAVADHLTSYGGTITAEDEYSQMSALRWLEAGVTGSYGTVIEPCAFRSKFPDPPILFQNYFAGASLIESYWKSVAMPIEGLFIGEPLAKPWGTKVRTLPTGEVEIFTTSFQEGKTYYILTQSALDATLYDVVQTIAPQKPKFQTIKFTPSVNKYYLLSQDEVVVLNHPPVLAAVGNKTVEETKLLSFTLSATDVDKNPLKYQAVNLPQGASLNAVTGAFSWTPTYTQAGTYNLIFEVTDGTYTDSRQSSIQVSNVNRAPILAAVGNANIAEDKTLNIALSASDPDADPLTYSVNRLPQGATLNPNTGAFSWKPSFTQAGLYSDIQFTVSDGSLTASRTMAINVVNTNRIPVLSPIGNKAVNEGAMLAFTLSSTDPDGDPLTYSSTALPEGAIFNPSTGEFSWTPNFTQAGTKNIRFYVTDGKLKAMELISIIVANVNRPPILSPIGSKMAAEGVLLQFVVSASDPDGTNPILSAKNLPSGSSFNASTKTFSWTPKFDQSGTYIIPFSATDRSLAVTENVTVDVQNTNRVPVLSPIGSKAVIEGASLQFVVNASDPDGTVPVISATNLPEGAIFNANTRTFSWTPKVGQAGTYIVPVTVTDGSLTVLGNVSIVVKTANRPPAFKLIGNKTVLEGSSLQFVLNATDPDANALTFSASNLPSGATFNASTRTFAWAPTTGQAGTYNVSFGVSDGSLAVTQTVAILVGKLNRPPILEPIGSKTIGEGVPLQFVVNASDPDGTTPIFIVRNLPTGATFNASTKTFAWTPQVGQAGTYTIPFAVSDGSLSSMENVSIVVYQIPILKSLNRDR